MDLGFKRFQTSDLFKSVLLLATRSSDHQELDDVG